MCDAKTKVLCERVSQRNARLSFIGPEKIKVKGKAKKIEVFKVFPKKNASLNDAQKIMQQKVNVRAHPFRGRKVMIKRFLREVEKFQGDKKGMTMILEGPEGVGKTRMVDEILHQATRINMQWAMLTGDVTKSSYIQPIKSTAGECEVFLPFFAWKDIFAWLTELASLQLPDDDPKTASTASVGSARPHSHKKRMRSTRKGSKTGLYSTMSSTGAGKRQRASLRGALVSNTILLPTIKSPTKGADAGEDFSTVNRAAADKGASSGAGDADGDEDQEESEETLNFPSPKDAPLPRDVSSLKKRGMSRSARVLSSQSSAAKAGDAILLGSGPNMRVSSMFLKREGAVTGQSSIGSRASLGRTEETLAMRVMSKSSGTNARASLRMTMAPGAGKSSQASFRLRTQMAADNDPIYARGIRERANRIRQHYASALMTFFKRYDAEKFPFVDSNTYWTDNASLISSVVQVSLGQDEKSKALEGSSEFIRLQIKFLYNLLRARASKTPLMIVIDNAQWLDQASLGLVSKLAREPIPKLMLVLAVRPIVKREGLARTNSVQNMGKAFNDQKKDVKEHDPLARVRGTEGGNSPRLEGNSPAIKMVDGQVQKTNKRLLQVSRAIEAIKRNKHVHRFDLQGMPDE